jgi:hypothetical protein
MQETFTPREWLRQIISLEFSDQGHPSRCVACRTQSPGPLSLELIRRSKRCRGQKLAGLAKRHLAVLTGDSCYVRAINAL